MKQLYESIEEWMVKYKKNSVKAATYDRLMTSLGLMKHYSIAYVRLDVLCTDDIQDYLNSLVKDNYALTTIKKQYGLLTGYIKYANVAGIIQKPLYNGVKLPSQSAVLKQKKEIVAYSDMEQMALRRIFNTHKRSGYDVANFMLETGVRVGEALAVCWSDVDWSRKAIRVHRTFVRLGNSKKQFIQNSTKSFASNRTIPLSTKAYDLLKYLYEKDLENTNSLESVPSGYIFHDSNGSPITYEAMRYCIKEACSKAKVAYHGQHVFRHTFATNCYNRGCDVKVLSKLLGHSDVAVTYNTYIHLFGDTLEEMRKVLG